jgi:hypothetical protein
MTSLARGDGPGAFSEASGVRWASAAAVRGGQHILAEPIQPAAGIGCRREWHPPRRELREEGPSGPAGVARVFY